ncbi:MAG: dockerin type I repeat-containing protein [Clostridia bacterium]|nr:dockerin type I repeat-containing protein [Clostridia bacterium]
MPRFMKKCVALLLCVAMMTFLPTMVANATSEAVLIYVPDMTEITLYENAGTEEQAILFDYDDASTALPIANIFLGLFIANDSKSSGIARVNDSLKTIFQPILCTPSGDPVNENSGTRSFVSPVSTQRDTENYTMNIDALVRAMPGRLSADEAYVFNYDWRLDPHANADVLKTFIDLVLEYSGRSRVALLSGGSGGNVVNSYLYHFFDHAVHHVLNCVFLDSAIVGNPIISDLMSGELARTLGTERDGTDGYFDIGDVFDTLTGEDMGAAIARYLGDDPGGLAEAAFTAFLGNSSSTSLAASLVMQLAALIIDRNRLFMKLGSGYKNLMFDAGETIYEDSLREYMRNMPGLWALVPQDNYEKAIKFMFGGFSNIDRTLLNRIGDYRTVMADTARTFASLQAYGIGVNIVAGYNRQIVPLTASINMQSDGMQAVKYASLGATAADATRELETVTKCSRGHTHMERGLKIDAATCLLPESTWFIKNHAFLRYDNDSTAQFVVWLTMTGAQRSIWQNDSYPQFLAYSASEKELTPYSAQNSDAASYAYGDMDMDGSVDATDARLALRSSVGLEGEPSSLTLSIGDVDGDGRITAMDARLILRFSVNLITYFPVQTG